MKSLVILHVFCAVLFSTTAAAPIHVQSDLISTKAQMKSSEMLQPLLFLLSSTGNNADGEVQSNDADLIKSLLCCLISTLGRNSDPNDKTMQTLLTAVNKIVSKAIGSSQNTDSEAKSQFKLPSPFAKTSDQDVINAAMIEAFMDLPTEAKAEFLQAILGGLASHAINRLVSG